MPSNTRILKFEFLQYYGHFKKNFKNKEGYSDYRTIIQCFAVFKEINKRWNYVNDKRWDYIAASESLSYFQGIAMTILF
jgi:hypothetical protein